MLEFQESPFRGADAPASTASDAISAGLVRELTNKAPDQRLQLLGERQSSVAPASNSVLPQIELTKSAPQQDSSKNASNGIDTGSEVRTPQPRKSGVLDTTRALIDQIPAAEAMVGAITTRIAVLGISDRLHVDQYTVGRELAKLKSPVARQLSQTLESMRKDGWQVWKQGASLPDRGEYVPSAKKLWYSPKGSMTAYMAGLAQSPIKQTVVPLAENLAYHHKNLLTYSPWWVDPLSGSKDARIMATREVLNGIKPRLVDVHISDQLNLNDSLTTERRTALKRGSLGAQILSEMPDTRKALGANRNYANRLVNEFTEWKLGGVVDRMTGKVSAFDIKAGLNSIPEALAQDASVKEYLTKPGTVEQLRKDCMFERRLRLASLSGFTETRAGSLMTRGGKMIGAVGLFALANDVGGAFQESTGSGFGRIGKVVVDWLGFEMGVRVGGSLLAESLPKMSSKGRLIGTLGMGLLSAHLTSEGAKTGEKYIKEMIDTELARRNHARRLSITDFSH